MRAWRLTASLHPPLTGEGAALRGGRWNSVGTAVIYASSYLSLALVELLVHVDSLDLPGNLIAYELEFPDIRLEQLERPRLPQEWRNDLRVTRALGDEWAESARSMALGVPSTVVAQESNILLNPGHLRFTDVKVLIEEPFHLDPRLVARREAINAG